MGRGGYRGGSTILGGGGWWSSFDPAASQSRPTTQRSGNLPRKSAKILAKRTPKSVLNDVVHAIVSGTAVTAKHIPSDLLREIAAAGGALTWARQQPRFEDLLRRATENFKKQKAAKKEKKKRDVQTAAPASMAGKEAIKRQSQLSQLGIEDGKYTPYFATVTERLSLVFGPSRSAVELATMLNRAGFRTASGDLWTRRLVLLALNQIRARTASSSGQRREVQ
jgi:hypothetical protein